MVVVIYEPTDLSFEVAGQIVVFEQDAVFERLMPTLDLALGLRMAGRATHVPHIALVQPFGQLRRDRTELPGDNVAREVVQYRAEINPAPAGHLEIGEVGLPKLVRRCRLILELI